MNQYMIFFLISMFCCYVPFLQGCSSDGSPKVVFLNTDYQFPSPFIVGSEIVTTFPFTNDGKGALQIEKIDSDCGCVATNTSADKIPPGGKGEIRIAVNRDVGGFRQNVFVQTNDPANPMVHLQVSGVILPVIGYPKKIILGQLEKGNNVSQTIEFTNNTEDVMELVFEKASDTGISVEIPEKVIPAGGSVEVPVVLSMNKVGFYSESLSLSAKKQKAAESEPEPLELMIRFQGRVLGGLLVVPQNLFLGVLKETESVQREIQIKSDGSDKFKLKKVSANGFSVSAALQETPSTDHNVMFSIAPKENIYSTGLIEGTIQITTDHPDVSEISIPIKAVRQ